LHEGRITLIDSPVPEVEAGTVRVRVRTSLFSPGTEFGGWHRLENTADPGDTAPRPFGYANAGVVEAVGAGVTRFCNGDRVACMGPGALHTNLAVVPQNLCVALPDGVAFGDAAYGHLAATAMHVHRRSQASLGEFSAVAGLGVLGQLCAMVHQMAGVRVIGWDPIPQRLAVATRWGIDAVAQSGRDDVVAATERFTQGQGLDTAALAFGGQADAAVRDLIACFKTAPDGHPMGRLMIPGGAHFAFPGGVTNLDICRVGRTGFGYHDEAWERGADYPPTVMRWTTQTNLDLCMRLIADNRFPVKALTTHTVCLEDAEQRIAALVQNPDEMLGVVLTMPA